MDKHVCDSFLCLVENHAGLAAWVQAVVAGVTIYAAGRQGSAAFRRQQRASTLKHLQALLAIADHAKDFYGRLIADAERQRRHAGFAYGGRAESPFRNEFTLMKESLASIPISELPSYEVIRSVMLLKQVIGEAERIAESNQAIRDGVFYNRVNLLQESKAEVELAREKIQSALVAFSRKK